MYLMSDLVESEYIKFDIKLIPQRIIHHYNLNDIVEDKRFVYAKINKTWFGFKQNGKITHDDLVMYLNKHGCVRQRIQIDYLYMKFRTFPLP